MAKFSDFKAEPFRHCTYTVCELAVTCIHTTVKKLVGDLYIDMNNVVDGACSNYGENLTIKYKIKVKEKK